MKTWITETEPEEPIFSVDITDKWVKGLCAKMNDKRFSAIAIPSSNVFTHIEAYDISDPIHAVIQCNEDCSIHFILN